MFELFGYQWVAHKLGQAWEISEVTTGRKVAFNEPCNDLQQAIERAKAYISSKGEKLTHQVVAMAKEQQMQTVR